MSFRNKKYTIKKFAQSPFNQDDVGKNLFILCELKTGNPAAEISEKLPWYLKEGDEITSKDVKLISTSKRSKFLIIGDTVELNEYHGFVIGELEKIEENESDYWDDIFYLKNCRIVHKDAEKFVKGMKIEPEQKIKRRDCKHKMYLSCEEFKLSDKKKWDILEKEWTEFTDGCSPSHHAIMSFLKKRVEIKN